MRLFWTLWEQAEVPAPHYPENNEVEGAPGVQLSAPGVDGVEFGEGVGGTDHVTDLNIHNNCENHQTVHFNSCACIPVY